MPGGDSGRGLRGIFPLVQTGEDARLLTELCGERCELAEGESAAAAAAGACECGSGSRGSRGSRPPPGLGLLTGGLRSPAVLPGEALAGFYGATTEFASDAAATDAVRSAAASRLARCAPERAQNAPGTRARVRAGGVRACALRCPALIPVLSCAGRVLRSRTGEDALETLRTSREVCAQRSRLPFPRSCGSSRLRRSDPADPRIRNMLCFCPLLWRWLAGGSSATTELAHTCARTTHLRRSAAHGGATSEATVYWEFHSCRLAVSQRFPGF